MLWPGFHVGLWGIDPIWGTRDLQRRVGRLFGEFVVGCGDEFPCVNLWTNDEEAMLTIELPGVVPEEVSITVEGRTFKLEGTRQDCAIDPHALCRRQERATGRFVRVLELPFKPEGDAAKAEFRDGVLRVHIPRAQEDTPPRIAVTAEQREGGAS